MLFEPFSAILAAVDDGDRVVVSGRVSSKVDVMVEVEVISWDDLGAADPEETALVMVAEVGANQCVE